MFPLYLIAWALGGWLVVVCTALIWAERIRIYLRIPVCDRCGYSLEGLTEAAACPECNSRIRRIKPVTGTPGDGPAMTAAWVVPFGAAVAGAMAVALVFGVGGLGSLGVLGMFILMGLPFGLLIRSLVRWLPPVAIQRMTFLGCGAMIVAAAWFGLITERERVARDLPLLAIMGTMVWPFCGFGIAAGLFTVPAESWLRETIRRVRHARAHRE